MATRWASNTGSTIIGSLNIDTIAWQSGTTVRYTFSGSPDLSGVVVGHQLQATGCTNALHNGTFEITAVSNASDYIEVTNTAISDASNDESSSPGTGTAKTGASLVQEPTSAKQALGWLNGEKPPAGYFNWQAQNSGRVQVATADIGYSTISSSSYTAIGGEGFIVCPVKSSVFAATVSSSSAVDVTGSTITPTVTSGKRVLVGSSFDVDYAEATSNSGRITLGVDGSALTGGNEFYPANPRSIGSLFHLVSSATAGQRDYSTMAYESGGTANLVFAGGRTWACEFENTAAADSTDATGSTTISSTTYGNITSVSLSPTNNPVLLLAVYNSDPNSDGAQTHCFRFYDGSTAYGEWKHRYTNGFTRNTGCAAAWITGSLNGAQTIYIQHKSLLGTTVGLNSYKFIAIELQGDVKDTAKPAGSCSLTASDATITDGSTPLSYTFTPGADIDYLAILTFSSLAVAGTGTFTVKIKVGATELISVTHAKDDDPDYGTPITIAVPTGTLPAGVSVTVSATGLTSGAGDTFSLVGAGFFLVEAPALTDVQAGDPAEVELTDVSPGRVRVDWSSQRLCSADVALSYALYENVNAGGAVEVFSKTLTAPGTADQDCSISWLRPTDLAEGDDVTYTVRAKMASGNVVFAAGYLSATEVPSL